MPNNGIDHERKGRGPLRQVKPAVEARRGPMLTANEIADLRARPTGASARTHLAAGFASPSAAARWMA